MSFFLGWGFDEIIVALDSIAIANCTQQQALEDHDCQFVGHTHLWSQTRSKPMALILLVE